MQAVVRNLLAAGFVFLIGFSYVGCGVKGPPLPPRQRAIPAVVDLSYSLSGEIVTLTWSLAQPLPRKETKEATFILYRSQQPVDADVCENCPQFFEKVTTIPYVDQPNGQFETIVTIAPGYRYRFKVRLETRSGIGSDSSAIRFDFISSDISGGPTNQ